jgi:energy-coupling factor transport system permease protein
VGEGYTTHASLADAWHPSIALLLFASLLILTMAAFEPVCAALALGGAFLYGVCTRGVRESLRPLVWQLPLLAIVCLINPLFTGLGSTQLCVVLGRAVYVESLVFGATMGSMLVAVLAWCSTLGAQLGSDAARYAIARPLPLVALMLSMSMRLVALFVRRGKSMDDTQTACTAAYAHASPLTSLAWRGRLLTALVGWGLEDSFDLSDSIIARGWASQARRSSYGRRSLRWRDAVALACVGVLVALDAGALVRICSAWHFYPTLSGLSTPLAYLPHALVMALPTLAVLADRLAWDVREARA